MIKLTQVMLQRGLKTLLSNASVTINPGQRVGLVGANGAGKSSLFALLRNELQVDGGELSFPPTWQVAHVAQETPALDMVALDYVLQGDTRLHKLTLRMAELEAHSADEHGEELAHLHADYADADGYTARSRASALLLGLGFTLAALERPVASFSGGWRMRLNLAQALMCPSDLLLLDEPTNHLDLDAIVWLEDWLKRYTGTLIVISHDREFLDAICTAIVHIEDAQLKLYTGDYSSFEVQRATQREQAAAAYAKQQQQVAHLQSFIDRFKAKATKAKQAQSRVKALERMEKIAAVRDETAFTFSFAEANAAPNPLLRLDTVNCGYQVPQATDDAAKEQIVILQHISQSLQQGQRIGLLGANGQGKSTLIKTLAQEIAPLSGEVTLGKGLAIGYFAQHQLETLRPEDSALQHLARLAPDTREQELRDFLGRFKFAGEMATQAIEPFSGGEKARLALALTVWLKPNLLLLDEPTNHLDLELREALTLALAQFEGTMLLVSHDRALLRATCDEFWLVADGQVKPFDGDLDDYREWLNARTQAQQVQISAPATTNNGAAAPAASHDASGNLRKLDRKEAAQARQALSAQKKPLLNELKKVETNLQNLQARLAELTSYLADENSYSEANKARLTEAIKEQSSKQAELETVEMRWLELQETLEQLEQV